jgi:hypothetical protein
MEKLSLFEIFGGIFLKDKNTDSDARDVMDSIYKDYEKNGGFKKLPGMGKPLPKSALQGDIFTNIVKNAGYLPGWIKMQKDIKLRIEKLMKLKCNEQRILEAERINQEILKYNLACPVPLQKNLLSLEEIEKQYKLWE